jgi:hypothetical protein
MLSTITTSLGWRWWMKRRVILVIHLETKIAIGNKSMNRFRII